MDLNLFPLFPSPQNHNVALFWKALKWEISSEVLSKIPRLTHFLRKQIAAAKSASSLWQGCWGLY